MKGHYSPLDRAKALALSEEVGPAEAARRLGIKSQTVTAWRAKAKAGDPTMFADDVELGTELLAEPTGGYSVSEMEARQRRIGRELDDALERGKTTDARNLTVMFGIFTDKIAKAREARPSSTRGEDSPVDEAVQQRLARVVDRMLVLRAGRDFRALERADDRALDGEMRTRYVAIAALEREIRLLSEQRRRLRLGEPSLFGVMQDLPDRPVMPSPIVRAGGDQHDLFEAADEYQTELEVRAVRARRRLSVVSASDDWRGPRRGYDPSVDHEPPS